MRLKRILEVISYTVAISASIGWFMTSCFARDRRLKKWLKWLCGITGLIALIAAALCWKEEEPKPAVSIAGQNSPAANVSGISSGATVNINQAGRDITVGLTDEGIKRIQEGLIAIQKLKDAELKTKFNLGYILFTATDRNEIIPLKSPMDSIIKIDWESGYEVSFTEDQVSLRLPDMTISPPDAAVAKFHNSSVTVLRRFEPWGRPGIYNNGKVRVAFKVVSTNSDSVTIAMGMQSPPEPRPPLSELMK